MTNPTPAAQIALVAQIEDARARTLALIDGLDAAQLMGPRLAIVNPLRWEIGHAAYFYELWVLRHHFGEPPGRPDVDRLYDSINIAHDTRWDLPLPSLPDTLAYMQGVLERVRARLGNGTDDPRRDYLAQYALYHEDMHTEAFTYTRQTLGYPAPAIGTEAPLERVSVIAPMMRRATPRCRVVPSCSGPCPRTASASTTRSGPTRWTCNPSASPGAR